MSIKDEFTEASLEAQAEMMQAIQEITGELTADEIITEMKKVWATMPDAAKEQFKAERPVEYAAFIKQLEGENYAD